MITAELQALSADAAALKAQVSVGDVVQATVLPSNGLTDLVTILGNRVAAALPPTLRPGDTINAQITGFNGDQIVLSMVDDIEASDAANPAPSAAPAGASAALSADATVAGGGAPGTAGTLGQIAPPVAVFVAGSVRSAAGMPIPVRLSDEIDLPGTGPPPSAQPAGVNALLANIGAIEARVAASRAGSVSVSVPGAALRGPANSARVAGPFSVPPSIGASQFAATAVRGAVMQATPSGSPPAVANAAGAAVARAPIGSLAQYRDPVALVRALRLPVTPSNVAAAKLALDSPQRLPSALATLERALPNVDDPRVSTLRTLTAFIGRLDPRSPQLATQISAFVDHVVDGFEPKLAQQLLAQAAADLPLFAETPAPAPAAGAPAPPPAPEATAAQGAQQAVPAANVPAPTLPVVALAQAAERGAALQGDIKSQLFALLANPPAGGDDLVPAAASALTAITSVQLAGAQAMAQSPSTVMFTLPMWVGSGYAQARVTVDRDAPQTRNKPLDGDNFHIGFILETKHLGTVAIDVQTVGRAVNLAVKTEATMQADLFGSSINRLTERLENLRYRVASAEASVSRPAGAPAEPVAADVPPPATVDEPLQPGGLNARA